MSFPRVRSCFVLAAFMVAAAGGCVDPQTRQKAAEESERDKDLNMIKTVGLITEVSNVAPLPISGVGLVTGLSGTGGSPPPNNEFRKILRNQLVSQNMKNVDSVLDSPDNAMVLVSALIPPGVRQGERLDIDVMIPEGSKATSLRGGYLVLCPLKDYDTTKKLRPDYQGSDRLLFGHTLAKAHGPLLVGFTGKDEPGQLRRGRVWAGGVSLIDRPFLLVLQNDQRYFSVANAVAQRINTMFHDEPEKRDNLLHNKRLLVLDEVTRNINQKFPHPGMGRGTMARAQDKESININVPYAYRFNAQRYLRVVRFIPLQATPDKMDRYRQRLEKMLLDPADTVRAALRLEALGKDSIPVLKRGLESKQSLVRFASAEALSYLGSTVGCEQLARLAEQYSMMRSYALLALAGLEEAVCRQYLADMLAAPDAELRCGAFQALRLLDETDRNLRGEMLGSAFWLHRVAPGSTPMVFFSIRQRAEIVLFGSDSRLVPGADSKVMAGEFIVSAERGDDRCSVARFQTQQGVTRRTCSLRLEDILRTMADMGGQYPDAVQFLTKAEERRCVSCPIRCRTLPQEVSVEMLAQSGKDPETVKGAW